MKKHQEQPKFDISELERLKKEFFANGGKVQVIQPQPMTRFDLEDEKPQTKTNDDQDDITDDASTYTEIKLE